MHERKAEYKTLAEAPRTLPDLTGMDASWFYVLQLRRWIFSDTAIPACVAAMERLAQSGHVVAEPYSPFGTHEVTRYSIPADVLPSEQDAQDEATRAAFGADDEDEDGLIELLAYEEEARTGWGRLCTRRRGEQ